MTYPPLQPDKHPAWKRYPAANGRLDDCDVRATVITSLGHLTDSLVYIFPAEQHHETLRPFPPTSERYTEISDQILEDCDGVLTT